MDLAVARENQVAALVVEPRARRQFPNLGVEEARKVGQAAVDVGKTVFSTEIRSEVDEAGFHPHCRIGGECGDGAADQLRAFRFREERILGDGVPPVFLADAEMFEHRLGSQKARRKRERRNARPGQLHRHAIGEARQRRLDEVVENMTSISLEMPVDHFDDEAASRLNHERREAAIGDDVAQKRLIEIGADVREIEFPEALRPVEHGVGAPDAVDQNVEAAGFPTNALGEGRNLLLDGKIDASGDCAPARVRDQRRRLIEGLGTIESLGKAFGASTRAIDEGSGLSQRPRDAASRSPRRPSHQRDLAR